MTARSYVNLDTIETVVRIGVPVAGLILTGYLTMKLLNNLNPTSKDKRAARKAAVEILKLLKIPNAETLTDYEVNIATMLINPDTIEMDWNSIGGHRDIIEDLQVSVITPFNEIAEFVPNSKLFKAPKGVLLHGPPGCGKTLIAKAMAKSANARFINLEIKNLVNMWYGESQKLAEAVFSLARKIQPTIIFIDEIDSFLNSRSSSDNEATRMMKTQFMALWDGILSASDRIMVVGTTNRPSDLDSAILRRLPYKVHIPMPDKEMRQEIYKIILQHEKINFHPDMEDSLEEMSRASDGLSGSDIQEVCRSAALTRFSHAIKKNSSDNLRPDFSITKQDIMDAIEKFRSSHRDLLPKNILL